MRTKTVNVYRYEELSEAAKYNVKQWLNSDTDNITKLLSQDLENYYEIPNAELRYSLGYCQGDGVSFTGQWNGSELHSILSKAYEGNIPKELTKLIPDLTLKFTKIDRHYSHAYTVNTELVDDSDTWESNENIIEAAEKVIDSWRISICRDLEKTGYAEIEYSYSDEAMIELCDSNDYEFYANGELA